MSLLKFEKQHCICATKILYHVNCELIEYGWKKTAYFCQKQNNKAQSRRPEGFLMQDFVALYWLNIHMTSRHEAAGEWGKKRASTVHLSVFMSAVH